MEPHAVTPVLYQTVTGYDEKSVKISETLYTGSFFLAREQPPCDWPVASFETLALKDFNPILALKPEVLILGTGKEQRFLPPAWTVSLFKQGLSVECMNNRAACRTYSLLVHEGRKAALALIMGHVLPNHEKTSYPSCQESFGQ